MPSVAVYADTVNCFSFFTYVPSTVELEDAVASYL